MNEPTKIECHCQKTECGCGEAPTEACPCGQRCDCGQACGCGGGSCSGSGQKTAR